MQSDYIINGYYDVSKDTNFDHYDDGSNEIDINYSNQRNVNSSKFNELHTIERDSIGLGKYIVGYGEPKCKDNESTNISTLHTVTFFVSWCPWRLSRLLLIKFGKNRCN